MSQSARGFVWVAALAWMVALLDSAGALLGLWSVTQAEHIHVILAVEAAVMVVLVLNSAVLRRWVKTQTSDPLAQRVATLCFLSLLICLGGDVVNFNLPQTYFRHGEVVKHDYLADSVSFFAPGYALLLAAVVMVAKARGVATQHMLLLVGLAALAALASFAGMVLPNTGMRVALITGAYSVLITCVGVSGWWLLQAYGGPRQAPLLAWAVAAGLLLALVADAIIGSFWIYGNNGHGFFPVAREVNWVVYVGSQALVMQLPRLLVSVR